MPSKTEGLVLTVDPHVLHKVDTENPENFFSIWALFSRCADSVEQGRRLENLSWRLWNREIQCCEAGQTKQSTDFHATSFPKAIPHNDSTPEMPQLSGSVDSAMEDEEAVEFSSDLEPVDILRPAIMRQDSCASSQSRGKERHITSDHLERMVVSIIQETEPNLNPLPEISSPSIEPESDTSEGAFSPVTHETLESPTTPATEPLNRSMERHEVADSSELSSSANTHNTQVIRGFSPSQIPIPSLRIMSQEYLKASEPDIPDPHSSPAHKPVQLKKQPAKFALGGSSGDESSPSLEAHQPIPQPPKKKGMFSIGESSGSNDETPSLKSAMHSGRPNSLLNAQKKQTSFSNQVTTRTIQTPSDQSDSYMDESAIDDDEDDSEWEDSIEESGKSSMDDPVTFKRVPSKPNLTSQRSLISLMFAGQDQRSKGLGNHASQSTSAIPLQRARTHHNAPQRAQVVASPNDSDDNGLEMKRGQRRTPLRPINEIPRSIAQPIMASGHSGHQAALSPRTTRRNMLATELTESLRRHLLWERQHKSSTANAVLKRRHTSHDVANLKQYPEKSYMGKEEGQTSTEEPNASSWNQYLERDALGGYHAQGW
ncbi:hypothetical protein SCUP234_03595 [Seiridium cupressi]